MAQQDPRGVLLDLLPRHSVGAEIGVHLGEFSQLILDQVAPRELHLIDPWQHLTSAVYKTAWYGGAARGGQSEMDERHAAVCRRFERQVHDGQVSIHRGYSTDVLERFPDAYFDWVYIDGNHLYEYVVRDLDAGFRKTRIGGLVTGDDYTDGGWWDGGVKKAVDEFSGGRAGVEQVAITRKQYIFRRTA
jgi:hypothetical protein